MAIIDRKLDEDAQRQAREYAERNDRGASQDWQQPPPAYEEAPSASSTSAAATSSVGPPSNSRSSQEHADTPEQRSSRQDRRRSQREFLRTDSDVSDESLPLLTRRQKLFIKERLRSRKKVEKMMRFLGKSLLLLGIVMLTLKLAGLFDRDDILPDPPSSDGHVVGKPAWTAPVLRKPDLWPDPNVPLYSSETTFRFSAFDEFFLHATGSATRYSGRAVIANVASFSDEDVEKATGSDFIDEVFVRIEIQFTEISLRESVRVNKMQVNDHRKGVGIYGSSYQHLPTKTSFMAINVEVWVPHGRRRTAAGLAADNSSFLPELDIALDNMRLAIEGMHNPVHLGDNRDFVTVGRLRSVQLNGGADLVSGFVANESFSISLQNGQVRDILWSPVPTIISPRIAISIVNGPIWLNKLVARESISLRTVNGGINITDVAIAKSIRVKHTDGILGGRYRANDLDIYSELGGTVVNVDLRRYIFEGESQGFGLPWADSHDRYTKCRQVRAKIHNEVGEVFVRYVNHEEGVLLNSSVSTSTGSIVVQHDSGFEGTFDVQSQLGVVEIQGPRSVSSSSSIGPDSASSSSDSTHQVVANGGGGKIKRFEVETRDRGPHGNTKATIGRTWWNDHAWEDEASFCKSTSSSKSSLGSLFLTF